MIRTEALFLENCYLAETAAEVVAINGSGGIVLDRTVFYATSGGQPGDIGCFVTSDGTTVAIAATITGETKEEIIHMPVAAQAALCVGDIVTAKIDWQRRHRLMRMHTACHLLTVVCPYPITGASVSADESRVDFDIPDAGFTKEDVTAKLMDLVHEDHGIYYRWITDDDLSGNPGLVKSKNVRPPAGTGRIRLVCIGADGLIDSQPCGGTHVERAGEIGEIHVGKIEKKGRENRRFRLRFGPLPAN